MREQIAIADLWCYQNATAEERNWKYISPTYKFDLSKIGSSKMREEVSSFLIYRGQKLKLKSIRAELLHYNCWVRYAQDNILNGSLSERDIDQEIREYKKYLTKLYYMYELEEKPEEKEPQGTLADAVREAERFMREDGVSASDAAKRAAKAFGFKKGEIYKQLTEGEKENG